MIENLDPKDIARRLAERSIILIDVREPAEYAAERIPGAVLHPLSTFDPRSLPESGSEEIVFHCGSGVRSRRAVEQCRRAGLNRNGHMTGGIQAWKAAGLPTIKLDPATGRPAEAG